VGDGNISKSSDFSKHLFKKVKTDASHPINNGVHMQAHHLISAKGVDLSGIGVLLVQKGYDINVIKNLVFIPSTLPGACHLGVQLHRGDHIHKDDEHPKSYHVEVKEQLVRLKEKISNCEGSANTTQKLVNSKSKELLSDISDFNLSLTSIMKSFDLDSPIGCGNCVNVKEHEKDFSPCSSQRDHYQQKHPMYKSGKDMKEIILPKRAYKLRVGK